MSFRCTDILNLLSEEGVDFVVIGGIAAALQGCTCHTQDLDICCDFSPANLMRLQKALSGLHPVHRMTPGRKPLDLDEKNCRDLNNLYLDTDLGQLDCLSAVQGIGDFQTVKNHSEPMKIPDSQLQVLTVEALIESKKSLHRDHDREAIRQLEAILKTKKKFSQTN